MRKFLFALCFATLGLSLAVSDAEAKRLGGGKSIGMQRESVSQRAPEAPRAAPTPAPTAAPGAAAATPKRNWLGPIAGLAAGLGLAALASHFGFGEELANFLMIALLAFAAIALVRFLMRKKAPAAPEPLRYAGVPEPAARRVEPTAPAATSVGGIPATRSGASNLGFSAADLAPNSAPNVPEGFDVDGFLRVAKLNFVRLQAANDKGDLGDLREFLSPEVYAEVKLAIDERQGAAQETDVVTLNAELLEVVTEGDRHVASVHFSGMVREEAGAAAVPFAEVWNIAKPVAGERGWTVAGIQQLA